MLKLPNCQKLLASGSLKSSYAMLCNSIMQRLRQFGLRTSLKLILNKKKMQTKRTTEPKVMAFRCFQISMCILCSSNQFWTLVLSIASCRSRKNVRKRVVTILKWPNYLKFMASGRSKSSYAMLRNSILQRLLQIGLHRSRKVIWNKKKNMRPKRTTEAKVMAFRSFQISMHILCLSNHLGRSFSLCLLVHLVKTYENEWSRCSNG